MNSGDSNDLKQLALLAELARPLTHECNNFLNNLLLQLAISEKSFPDSTRAEWANVKSEAKKLATLFQQWQRQPKHHAGAARKFDLNLVIQESIEEIRPDLPQVQIHVQAADEPVWLRGFPGEMRRLAALLCRHAVASDPNSGVDNLRLELHLEKRGGRILLSLRIPEMPDAGSCWLDFDDRPSSERTTLSLTALACKSLAERWDGVIRIERDSNDCTLLVVDLPTATS